VETIYGRGKAGTARAKIGIRAQKICVFNRRLLKILQVI
jgi:hypothetical protein